MARINDTTTYPNTTPALTDHVIGTDVSDTTNSTDGEVVTFTLQAVMDEFVLGHNQTWQDVSGSRAFTTAYQNTTGKPIAVSIFVSGNNDSGTSVFDLQVSADDVTYLTIDRFHTSSNENFGQFRAEIPDDIYYKIIKVSGSNTIYSIGVWAELR